MVQVDNVVFLNSDRIRRDAVWCDGDMLVTLDFEARVLRRKRLVTDCGNEFIVDLAETISVNAGDAFLLEDGRQIIIQAAIESVVEIRHETISRIAWHIGNRHTPCEIKTDHVIIRRDHVLEDLLLRLGAKLRNFNAPFNPEGGAYGIGRTHGHNHNDV